MFTTLKRLYDNDRLGKSGLQKAVNDKGWITESEYEEITGESFPTN